MTCTFFGHRNIFRSEIVRERLIAVVEQLIEQGVIRFLVGVHGDFDRLALSVLRQLRKKFNNIQICVVLTSVTMIQKGKVDYSLADAYKDVETFIYPIENEHYKRRITVSNQSMINESDCVICYADNDRYRSGAKKSMEYAQKKGKKIVNLFKKDDKLINKV